MPERDSNPYQTLHLTRPPSPPTAMASSPRSRSWDPDQASDADAGSFTEGSSDSSSDYDPDPAFESMTAKGIKRLCSELLELKKASDEEFQRNVSSNLAVFVRIFEEVGGVEVNLGTLKQHVLAQKRLLQNLSGNLYSGLVLDELEEMEAVECEDSDDNDGEDVLETLDALLMEHRMEEALTVIQDETENLQKQIKEEGMLPGLVLYMSEISDRRDMLADQLASLAGHPRVSQPELQYALDGLSRLGESNRVNLLLIRFYRARLESCMNDLQSSVPFLHGSYMMELAKMVFSTMAQAARCCVMLYGDSSRYPSELIRWTREEVEAFSRVFDKYVKSISENSEGLTLAVEAANSAISYCGRLNSQNMVLQPYLTKLIRISMEEVLQMHMDHYKKVVCVFATTDTWVLSRFPISVIFKDISSFTGVDDEVEYCPLTISGRKLVRLMQAIVDDISPLVILQMENSILKGLANLFKEYMHTLQKAIPISGHDAESDILRINPAEKLEQQISLLINSSTLVYFFPSIAGTIIKGNRPLSPEHTELSSQNELDNQMMSILEAADRLRGCFCQEFVYEVMSHGECYPKTNVELDVRRQSIFSSEMPSLAFQALFQRLRQLELSKSIFAGEDGIVKMLLEELMETVISWLSNNQDFWERTNDNSSIPKHSYLDQVHIDMYFLLEIANRGGYFSEDLMVAALDLIAQIEEKFTDNKTYPHREELDVQWASEVARLAIDKLIEIEVVESERKGESVATFVEDSNSQNLDSARPSEGEDAAYAFKDYNNISALSFEEDETKLLGTQNSQSLEGNIETSISNEEGSVKPAVPITHIEDEHDWSSQKENGHDSTIENSDASDTGYLSDPDIDENTVIVIPVDMSGSIDNKDSSCITLMESVQDDSPKSAKENTLNEVSDFEEGDKLVIEKKLEDLGGSQANHAGNSRDGDIEGKSSMLQIADQSEYTDKSSSSSPTVSVERAQDDSPRVSDEWTTDEAASFEEEPRARRGSKLVVERSSEKQAKVRAARAGGSRRNTSTSGVLWSVGPRPKTAEELGKKKKGVHNCPA